MYEPKRLHLLAILLQTLSTLKDWLFSIITFVLLFGRDDFLVYTLIAFGVLSIIVIAYSILSWFRFTYTYADEQLRIEKGIFIRKKRTISKQRIQSINLSQNIIHRIFGLTKVQIETAGSDLDVDAKLIAVTMHEGEQLRKQLKPRTHSPVKTVPVSNASTLINDIPVETVAALASDHAETDDDYDYDYDYVLDHNYPKYETSFKKLFVYGSTSGGFGIILAMFLLFLSEIEAFVPAAIYQSTTKWFLGQALGILIAIILLTLIIVWILGVFSTVIKYGDFTIVRFEKELYITRGLLEKKQLTIPLKRIQSVGLKQNMLRQPFGLATLFVEIAGGEVNKTEGMRTVILPLIRKRNIPAFLAEMLPEYQLPTEDLTAAPKRAIPYYLIKSAILPFLAAIAIAFLWIEWIWLPLIFFILTLSFGWLQYCTAGSHINDQQLTLQRWSFSKETVILKHRRIQAYEKKQHFLHRKQRLATVKVSILNNLVGQHYVVTELSQEVVDQIGDWYSYRE